MYSREQKKIVSLVPSWTFTFLAAGAHVVGRTRYCIHPLDLVDSIPIWGGTKDIRVPNIQDVDYVILDREENTKSMAESVQAKLLSTHVTSLASCAFELRSLAETLKLPRLADYAQRYETVIDHLDAQQIKERDEFPGATKWFFPPTQKIKKVIYVIWKDPWMCLSEKTFAGDILTRLGYELWTPASSRLPDNHQSAYPIFHWEEVPSDVVVLYSTEPYPFDRYSPEPDRPSALVDGEAYTWFGLKSLRFLEDLF